MKNLEIYSKPKKVPIKTIIEYLKFSIDFIFGQNLKKYRKLKIKIFFDDNGILKDMEKESKTYIYGVCLPEDGSRNPNTFQIFVKNDLSKKQTLTTLSHELVHVYQYRTGLMRNTQKYIIWKNKKYDKDIVSNGLDENENLCPWEEKAFSMENEIYESFKKSKESR
ncbi:MAG: hypothetical protein NZZ41_00850 [Candidatus Dojkabacteria bacterium]|nr:hypothetical protein [Candidatus Dojkabacteria bacterium]